MTKLGINKRAKDKHQGADPVDNTDPVYERLKEYNYDGKLLSCSDDFFNYFFRNCITRETISDVHLINRRNNIIMILDGNTVLNEVSYSKSTMFFNYELLCNDEFDLTPDENMLLWRINGLSKQISELYKTTKVFLDVSTGKIKDTKWNDEDDLLGYYTKKSSEPQVWLLMDRITHAAKRLCCDRKYIIAKVYIHEMMHRFFDMRPDLPLKRYIKEIEEPMAEFATLKFIEELSKQRATFEKLLPIAIVMTEGLRKTKKYFIYALGVDLYYKAPIKLIYEFRRISMLLHRSREDCKLDGIELKPSPMKYVEDYVKLCKPNQDLQQLVGPIKECIETYAKFFPQDKGIQ